MRHGPEREARTQAYADWLYDDEPTKDVLADAWKTAWDAGVEYGRGEERARIVADLRANAEKCVTEEAAYFNRTLADRIERGQEGGHRES